MEIGFLAPRGSVLSGAPPEHVYISGDPYETSSDFSKTVLMVDVTPLASLFFYVQMQ